MNRKTKKIKFMIGIMLFLLSIFFILMWEIYGREKFYYENALVVNRDIEKGSVILIEDLEYKKVDKKLIYEHSIVDKDKIAGMEAVNFLPKGTQIVEKYIISPQLTLGENEKIMKIPSEWIVSYPETLRRRDDVYMYAVKLENGKAYEKSFVLKTIVAYVKDNSNKEVINTGDGRLEASSEISDIEIIIRGEEFEKLKIYISNGYKLLIMYGK